MHAHTYTQHSVYINGLNSYESKNLKTKNVVRTYLQDKYTFRSDMAQSLQTSSVIRSLSK
ncbi:hypothetical protein Hanom_Chr15g01387231 [Helianthus anomalus]